MAHRGELRRESQALGSSLELGVRKDGYDFGLESNREPLLALRKKVKQQSLSNSVT